MNSTRHRFSRLLLGHAPKDPPRSRSDFRCGARSAGMRTRARRQSITRSTAVESHDAVIRVYDKAGNVIETHEYAGEFREP
jgi:hypothetical protein